jgi:multisubunit Na+/H+ antiporter MnhF subunit
MASPAPNPIATTHLPLFITPPGDADVLFNITLVFVVASVILTGVIFLTIHSLPERMAHKSKKIQFDIVALLGLLGLLSHEHVFWVAALLLAFIDIPDFMTPFRRIANSVETIAGQEAGASLVDHSDSGPPEAAATDRSLQNRKEAGHA